MTWKPPLLSSLSGSDSKALRDIFLSLQKYLTAPEFPDGFNLGDSTPAVYDPINNVTAPTPTVHVDATNVSAPPSLDEDPPDTPSGLVLTAGLRIVQARWTSNAELDVAGNKGYYEVQLASDGAFTTDVQLREAMGTATVFGDLVPDTEYWVRVKAFDSSGNESGYTAAESTTTLAVVADIGAEDITETMIADDAISTPKLQANAVTANEIAANTITAGQVAANTLTATEIAANAITASELAANSVTAAKLAAIELEVGKHVRSTDYASGVSGWSIEADGFAEFGNVLARGNIVANSLTTIASENLAENGDFSDGETNWVFSFVAGSGGDFSVVSAKGLVERAGFFVASLVHTQAVDRDDGIYEMSMKWKQTATNQNLPVYPRFYFIFLDSLGATLNTVAVYPSDGVMSTSFRTAKGSARAPAGTASVKLYVEIEAVDIGGGTQCNLILDDYILKFHPTVNVAPIAYTPVVTAVTTNPPLFNATYGGSYYQVGPIVVGQFSILCGANTGAGSGTYFFSLPVEPTAIDSFYTPIGVGRAVGDQDRLVIPGVSAADAALRRCRLFFTDDVSGVIRLVGPVDSSTSGATSGQRYNVSFQYLAKP